MRTKRRIIKDLGVLLALALVTAGHGRAELLGQDLGLSASAGPGTGQLGGETDPLPVSEAGTGGLGGLEVAPPTRRPEQPPADWSELPQPQRDELDGKYQEDLLQQLPKKDQDTLRFLRDFTKKFLEEGRLLEEKHPIPSELKTGYYESTETLGPDLRDQEAPAPEDSELAPTW